ncbi:MULTISPECIES: hypothetical protein [unclassified Mycolicibacterium]|uniref:hypothetical protein n=2 Tax=unclassified Mycolicibacterium TaxID=2636767 RepID=UPI0012DE8469|nr:MULTISPECIES: hypothetical protein [unclassified Mycolicibacterium]
MALSPKRCDREHTACPAVTCLPEWSSLPDLDICPRHMHGVAVGINESEPVAGVCDVLGCTRQQLGRCVMSEDIVAGVNDSDSEEIAGEIAVGSTVVVYPGTDDELHGSVVEDFADLAGTAVEVAGERFVEPARRWAVNLDDGGLVFVDDDSIALATQVA